MGGNKVAPPKGGAAGAPRTGKTYVGKAGSNANGAGGGSGYGPPAGTAVKKSGGMGGGASSAEVK